jgi:hypothetical protein
VAEMIDVDLLAGMMADSSLAQQRLHDMFTERAADDERFAALSRLMMPSRENAVDNGLPSPARKTQITQIRSRIAEMREDLITQSERNHMLADALGACSRCWGEDAACRGCNGAGQAGWNLPEMELFKDLIAPAFARLANYTSRHPQHEGDGKP